MVLKKHKKSFPIIFLFLFFGLFLQPFGLRAVAGGQPDKVVLQLAWKHQFQFAGYYAALAKGYYADAGLDVTLREGGRGGFAREAFLSGAAQYGVAGSELILYRAEGNPFVVLTAIFQHSPSILLTRKDSGISNPHDLMGKRVMLLPGQKDAGILAVFKNENIAMDAIRRLDQTFDLNDLIEGRTDAVSAYLTNEPWYLERAGITPGIIRPASYGVDFYGDCLFTTEKELKLQPERVDRFLTASLRGWQYAMAHPEEIIDILLTRYKVEKERAHLRFEAEAMQKIILPDLIQIGHMNPGRWQRIVDEYKALEMLEPDFSVKGFLYDPKRVIDYRWMKWGFGILLVACVVVGLLALMLLFFNRRLQKEVLERKQVETSLKLSEEKFSKAFHHGLTLMAISSIEDGRYLEVNENFVRITGYGRSEAVGATSVGLAFMTRKDRDRIKRYLDRDGSVNGLELTLRKKNGEALNCLYFAEIITIAEEKRVLSIASDITQRKQITDALKESEMRFRVLFEKAPVAIQGYDPEGILSYWNPASADLYGYTKEEAIGKNFIDLIIPSKMRNHVRKAIRHAGERGTAPSEELTLMRKDGSKVPILSNHVVLTKNGKTPELYCLDVDLTLQKQLQDRLEQARKSEAISSLAGGIAHQFNNVLSGITGNLDLIEMVFPGDENLLRYIERMKTAARRMTQLTGQLVAYARGGKYRPESLVMHDFVSNTLPLIKHVIDPAVTVEMDLPADSGCVKADPAQMQMVLMAVLANASEAMEGKGRIRITSRYEVLTSANAGDFPSFRPGNYVKLTIADDGKGMDEEARMRIFEPFFTTRFLGRGLGMAAVYGIIKNHDGWIFVDSDPGKGTCVNIYVPAVEVISQNNTTPKSKPVKGSGTILVIEDEKMVMEVSRALLTKMGYHVLEAATGQAAIDLARTFDGDIDMALLDIVLPDMDGKALYPLLMAERPDLKVIVCSGYSIDGPAGEIMAAGADDFIQKPFVRATLSEKLKKVSGIA
jgi:PAS domain S-box-containing protein